MAESEEDQENVQPLVSLPMDLVGVVQVDASDLASRLHGNQLIDLIGQIDEEKGSYYFSELLFRLFRDIRDAYAEERPDVASMTDRELMEHFLKEEEATK